MAPALTRDVVAAAGPRADGRSRGPEPPGTGQGPVKLNSFGLLWRPIVIAGELSSL